MEFIHSETRKNLVRSFAGESQARTRYTIYAEVARKENCEWIARVFEETAANEAVHAQEFLEMLQELEAQGTLENTVIIGVTDHYTYGYKDMASLLQLSGVEEEILLE